MNDPLAPDRYLGQHDRLLDLLSRWQELDTQGKLVTAAELCADCPELAGEVERLSRFGSALVRLSHPSSVETTPAPDSGTTPPRGAKQAITLTAPGERYEIKETLGKGGMGTVYRALDRVLDRVVALKVIRGESLSPAMRARFEDEARAVARLDHPHVIKVFDVGEFQPPDEPAPVPFLTLEYVKRGSLAASLRNEPTLPPVESARLVAMLARAMQHAHERGIVHRDLKPDNVLLAEPSDLAALNTPLGCPKITDFGLARLVQTDRRLTQTGAVMGTPAYMAPEQADGLPDVGAAADVYALGVILYRLLTGRVPFESPSTAELLYKICREPPSPLRQVCPEIPEELERICLDCLEKSPARRPAAAELAGRLERFAVAERPAEASSTTIRIEATRGKLRPRKRVAFSLRGCGVVATMSVTVGALLLAVTWSALQSLVSRVKDSAPGRVSVVSSKPGPDGEKSRSIVPGKSPSTASKLLVEKPLRIKPIRVEHYETVGKDEVRRGRIGEQSFSTRVGDGVTLTVELSEPGYFYVIAFNFDGKEDLLWPVNDEGKSSKTVPPPREKGLHYPGADRLFLDDNDKGGLQAYVAVASAKPLPAYTQWRKQFADVKWQALPAGTKVWEADAKGTYAVLAGLGPDRGSVRPALGAPPLAALCRALSKPGVVVEAIAFPVVGKEGKR